ncbi:hypothetical protein D9M68_912330 [compost metagenome]
MRIQCVPGVTRVIGPASKTYDGVSRRCADAATRCGGRVQLQHHALDCRQQVEPRCAVVGHSEEAADLVDVQSDDPAERLDQFEPLDVPRRILRAGCVDGGPGGQQALAQVVLDAGGRDSRPLAEFLKLHPRLLWSEAGSVG